MFDSTLDNPFSFTLGLREVIPGLEQGLLDICEGEIRTVIIPPDLGFGFDLTSLVLAGTTVPGGSTLNYQVLTGIIHGCFS